MANISFKLFLFLNAFLVLLLFRSWPKRNVIDRTMKAFCLMMSVMSLVFILMGANIN